MRRWRLSSLVALAALGVPAAAQIPSGGWQMVGQIGGPTQGVAVQGSYAYVGVGLRLVVLDISNPAALREVGLTAPFPHFVSDVAVSGTRAYVAAGGSGLRVVDISNPVRPVEIGAWDSMGYAEGVAVAGNTVYLADGPYGLRVVDVTNPAQPREVGAAYPVNYAFKVAVSGRYAYVAAAGAGLLIADVSNPVRPIEVATLDTPGYAYGVAVSGDAVYIADGWEGLRMVNVADPARPVHMRAVKTPGWAFGVTVSGRSLYVADAFKGLRVLDPSSLTELGGFEVSGGHAGSVAVAGSLAYVADRNWGLHAVNVSDPVRPSRAGFYSPLGYADAVAVSGNYAYVAAGTYGLRIVDISDPARPRQVGIYDTEGYATSVVTVGQHAYVATNPMGQTQRAIGLHAVDIHDPGRPARAGFWRDATVGPYMQVAVSGAIAYAVGEHGLELIEVSNAADPRQVGYIKLSERWEGGGGALASGVAVTGGLAFVAAQYAGLKVVDVSNPGHPTLIGQCRWPTADAGNVSVARGVAYLSGEDGISTVDVSNPRQPVRLSSIWPRGRGRGVALSASEAFVATGGAGLTVIDISKPAAPTLTGWSDTPGYALDLAVRGDYVYLADGAGGLLILRRLGAGGRPQVEDAAAVPQKPHVAAHPVQGTSSAPRGIAGTSVGPFRTFWPVLAGLPAAATCTVTSPADSGPGTLRWCLENAGSGTTVTFSPAVFPPTRPATIALFGPLPPLARGRVTIDGSSAGVILDGSRTPLGTSGLVVLSEGNVIKGLQIAGFPGDGIRIDVPAKNNQIGGDRTRGTGPVGEGNLISGNGANGIRVRGEGVDSNIIAGNLVGTTLVGTAAWGNGADGILVDDRPRRNRIGGRTSGERNIVSGNAHFGIYIGDEETAGNLVIGNYVGTDISGSIAVGNTNGVMLKGPGNRVGGGEAGERNVISGNSDRGVGIQGPYATGNTVVGNYIGLDAAGTRALGRTCDAVAIELGAHNNLVGQNVIVATGRFGVMMNDWGSSYNTVIGNLIGTDATGTVALVSPNGGVGMGWGAAFNRIGGTAPAERNVIAAGIWCAATAAVGNVVLGNFLGTDVSGTRGITSTYSLVGLGDGGQRCFVGGTTEAERNVISGNRGPGIQVWDSVDYAFIGGNSIGADLSGRLPLGNQGDGIEIRDATRVFVQRNAIAFNSGNGVSVSGLGSNTIRQNAVHSHTGRGIVLSEGGNNMLPAPVVMAVTGTAVSGTACAGCTVEIFSDAEDEGRVYEGSVVAGASGTFVFEKGSALAGPNITATATDRAGNTSELSGCGFGITPASAQFPAAGGTGSVGVTASAFCTWRAASSLSWVTITSGATGVGSAAVTFTVAPNTSPDGRSGSLTIAGLNLIVRQSGLAPGRSSIAVNGVVNGASFLPGLASATWITIYGINLAPTSRSWTEPDFSRGWLPTQLDGISVNFNHQHAFLAYISPTQINALVPDDPTEGPVEIFVFKEGVGPSNTLTAQKSRLAPAFFMFDAEGRKYVAAVHADGTYVGKPGLLAGLDTRLAAPEDIILLYGTGFGPTNPARPTGQIVAQPARLSAPVSLRIGGVPAEVMYAGLVAPGLYQFNVKVPAVLDGDQPVIAEIDGFRTQPAAYITIGK